MEHDKKDNSNWALQGISLAFVLGMMAAIFFALRKHLPLCWAIPGALLLSLFPAAMFFHEELEELRDRWMKRYTGSETPKEKGEVK